MFALKNLGQVWNWVTWDKKLGHQVKLKEYYINTLQVTFLYACLKNGKYYVTVYGVRLSVHP